MAEQVGQEMDELINKLADNYFFFNDLEVSQKEKI